MCGCHKGQLQSHRHFQRSLWNSHVHGSTGSRRLLLGSSEQRVTKFHLPGGLDTVARRCQLTWGWLFQIPFAKTSSPGAYWCPSTACVPTSSMASSAAGLAPNLSCEHSAAYTQETPFQHKGAVKSQPSACTTYEETLPGSWIHLCSGIPKLEHTPSGQAEVQRPLWRREAAFVNLPSQG